MKIFHASTRIGRGIGVNHDRDRNALLGLTTASDLCGITRAKFGIARKPKSGQVLKDRALSRRLVSDDDKLQTFSRDVSNSRKNETYLRQGNSGADKLTQFVNLGQD